MLAHSTKLYMALSQTLRSVREVQERDYNGSYHFVRCLYLRGCSCTETNRLVSIRTGRPWKVSSLSQMFLTQECPLPGVPRYSERAQSASGSALFKFHRYSKRGTCRLYDSRKQKADHTPRRANTTSGPYYSWKRALDGIVTVLIVALAEQNKLIKVYMLASSIVDFVYCTQVKTHQNKSQISQLKKRELGAWPQTPAVGSVMVWRTACTWIPDTTGGTNIGVATLLDNSI